MQVGYRLFDTGQLRRYREAVNGAPGEELVAVLAALHGEGLEPADVAALRTRPRRCPPDHPRLPLMRLRGLHVDRLWPPGDWLATGEAVDLVRAAWRAARPLADWLDAHVGRRTERFGEGRPPVESTAEPDSAAPPDTADQGPAHIADPDDADSVGLGDRGGRPRPDREKE